ncbi:MAG: hypothetical protein ACRDDY_17720 [Clostridium sp.]|uniref:hypothetical protein n=1 Tax=Clostridium sp. TaxID=1506 RepID=UPI003EE5150A
MRKTVKIKVVGDIKNFNRSRSYNINKYEKIKQRWDNKDSCLKRLLPEKYDEICNTLQSLKNGDRIEFINGQNDLICMIKEVGFSIGHHDIVHMRDNIGG